MFFAKTMVCVKIFFMFKFVFGILIFLTFFNACESNQVVAKKNSTEENKTQVQIFDDWKYIGFGNNPEKWVYDAFNNDFKSVAEFFGLLQNEITVFSEKGADSDQAEHRAFSKINENSNVISEFWVRVNSDYEFLEEPYIAFIVVKNSEIPSENSKNLQNSNES